ncbi:hypothetical protein FA13DRAFT_1727333 [Coprinellus micaceus]|uniref:F-box domain-containing protein n=1 Tax=Coprinellus micaceus TaxID=71717 RepID=A0A4Y7TS51_COPMI|nr:hypothetical protein FA13DRAFT_1727333 [Coprinellus micaceus]
MSNPRAIDKLADELWLAIFKISIEEGRLRWDNAIPIHYPTFFGTTPFTLDGVCKGWRCICLANTSLWDTIYMRFPPYERDEDDDYLFTVTSNFIACVDALQLWLERAGERDLSIFLDLQEQCVSLDFADAAAMRIPRLVVEHAGQVRRLETVLSAEWYHVFSGVEFPILEKLNLWTPEMYPSNGEFDGGGELEKVTTGPLDLRSCPRLASVEMHGSYRDHNCVVLPWIQIRDVKATWVQPLVYPEILDLMPNIRRCNLFGDPMYIDLEGSRLEDAERFEQMGRRRGEWGLEELEVSMDCVFIKLILDHSPLSLKRINLRPNTSLDPIRDATFLRSITPFSATLNSLSIDGYFFNDFETVIGALIQLKSLVSLQARIGTEERGVDDNFLDQTLCKSEVLPSLKTLAIRTTKLQFTWDTLQLVLGNRGYSKDSERTQCEVIQDLELTGTESEGWMEPTTPERVALLRSYVADGLRLSIGYVHRSQAYGSPPSPSWF